MAEWEKRFDAAKSEGTVLVLFIPSVDRFGKPIDKEYWVTESLTTLGTLFGGATVFLKDAGFGATTNAAGTSFTTHR